MTDELWITAKISQSRKPYPSVTEAVSTRLHTLLKGQLSERSLTQAELGTVAKALIDDMTPALQKTEAKE